MTNTIEPVILWTDGSCIGNPGPGGWAFQKSRGGVVAKAVSGGVCGATTNNAMELIAALQGLLSLQRPDVPVIVRSDSEYLVLGMNERTVRWAANGWWNSAGDRVANREIWEALLASRDARQPGAEITFEWVKAHSGVEKNELVDGLAKEEAKRAAGGLKGPWCPVQFYSAKGLMQTIFE